MIVGLQLSNYNKPSFKGRKPKNPMQIMNKVLMPLVDRYTPIKEIVKLTDYSRVMLNRWAHCNFGMTIAKLYRQRQNRQLEKEFIEHRQNGTSLKDMAKIYGHDTDWISRRFNSLGMDTINAEKNKLMEEHVPRMLKAGYTLNMMKNQLKVSINSLTNWINKNTGYSIKEYRRVHNIEINRSLV